MISVQNLQLRLSGSKQSLLLVFILFAFVACSATRKSGKDKKEGQYLQNTMEEQRKQDSLLAVGKEKQEKEIEEQMGPAIPQFENDFDVAVFLPFKLNKEPKPGSYDHYLRESVLDYYQGLLLGLDRLKEEGINLRLHVYDTKSDSTTVANLLLRIDMNDMDLIIGPLNPKAFSLLNELSTKNAIPLVSPFDLPEEDFSRPKPYTFHFSPKLSTYGKAVGDYIKSKEVPVQLFYLSDGSKTDKEFKKGLDASLKESELTYTLRKITPGMKLLPLMKEDSIVNIMIVPTDKEEKMEQAIEGFRQKFYKEDEDPDTREFVVELIGLDSWKNFRDPEFKYWERFNLSLFSNSHIDKKDTAYLDFSNTYKAKYKLPPGALSVKGYDQMIFLGNSLLAFGPYYPKYVLDTRFEGISMDYHWVFTGAVVENTALRRVRFYDYHFILRD